MKPAKIQHIRCDEHKESTYVWIPDAMSEDVLKYLVDLAQRDYLDAERAVAGEKAPQYMGWFQFEEKADKSKTLAQLKAEYAEHEAAYKSWCERRDAARKHFGERLHDISEGKILRFWNGEFVNIKCNWGHNHGVTIEYDETDIS